jgi:hypothetical protein
MRVVEFVRRGARVGACVLVLGAAAAEAQQVPGENAGQSEPAPVVGTESVKPHEPAAPDAKTAAEPATSVLPELVVDGKDKKKKKTVAAKEKGTTSGAGAATTTEPPPPGVTLGATAVDTGTTTFDANSVQQRVTGSGDANSFARNLPNVQYQNSASRGGASSSKTIDTKPQALSISGGKTYENNFILNGVSITNITGPQQDAGDPGDTTSFPSYNSVYGVSPQTVFIPSEFIGNATVIDSNASAKYGQFMGGVVVYDLAAPPTDHYRASVSASRETSDTAHYVLATPDGLNPGNRAPPSYEKNKLSASLGAPITNDFAIIGQVSRIEAESSKPKAIQLGNVWADENSDNAFFRFAASARTDIGKFTLDTSYTDYFQHWENYTGKNVYIDMTTQSSTTKLEYETKLASVRVDSIGLGNVNLLSRAFYNDSDTKNTSGDSIGYGWMKQGLRQNTTTKVWSEIYKTDRYGDWCPGVDPTTFSSPSTTAFFRCLEGGSGNTRQSQTDFGAQAILSGDVLLGNFTTGADIKQYEGHRARSDTTLQTSNYVIDNGNVYSGGTVLGPAPVGGFNCGDFALCNPEQFTYRYGHIPTYDLAATVNALHAFAEVEQGWKWFDVRAGARLDYDDYMKNINIAPRVAGTVTPFDRLSITGGYNRYYIGETLYYALRDKQSYGEVWLRSYNAATGLISQPTLSSNSAASFKASGLATPYSDEYTGAVRITDPLVDARWRFKYLERYGHDQFATTECGAFCWISSNDGEKFYRAASAEFTKEWNQLRNPYNLSAAAITGNVTWSEQKSSANTYLGADVDGDGINEAFVSYNKKIYTMAQFGALTGNLDIPVRFGATLATVWFDNLLELNVNAGVNLGFNGVYNTGTTVGGNANGSIYEYKDKVFDTTLKLDISGRINVSEFAAIDFYAGNITSSAQNTIGTVDNPWALGRSFWVGSTLKLQ